VTFSRYATEQRIDWTFSSQHTATQQNLPLLAVRYQATLDPYGRARAGKPCTVNIWLEANSALQRTSATATAHDQAGNGVDQTVIRAFGLT
jgi:hypothetical protein